MGYLEGRAHHKRWIVWKEDLKLMYESFNPEDDIKGALKRKLLCNSKTLEGPGVRALMCYNIIAA